MEGSPDPRLQPFTYELPDALIARYPPPERDGGRLLDLRAQPGGAPWADRRITDLPSLLSPGDLLVVNDTRVLAARLAARRASGGSVEVLLLSGVPDADGAAPALVRPARRLKPGERLEVLVDGEPASDLAIEMVAPLPDGRWRVRPAPSPAAVMAAAGQIPLPPYLERAAEPGDAERYQTVYAGAPGAVAAPTAGLHLSPPLLAALEERGVALAALTLHVGVGTFRPLRPEDLDAGRLHPERFHLPAATVAAVESARASGGRVVAVGTTTTRCLEAAAATGVLRAGEGETALFIRPGYRFAVVDALLTNFHLPASSLLMLVCAFGGADRVMAAYRHAVAARYRFYSYGDAMLLEHRP